MWANPNVPNLPDYTLFVGGVMGISTVYLPADSPFLGYAFNRAMALVINVLGGLDYTLAVYNCAGHIQLMITPDQVVDGTSYTFFTDYRKAKFLNEPVVGLVLSSSDDGTSVTNAVPDALKQLTIGDLGFMRTRWGLDYLAYVQDYGPGVWGLS
jgi:hypothetical protein